MPARLPALGGPVRPSHLWALVALSIVAIAVLFPSPTNAAPTSSVFSNVLPGSDDPDVGNSDEEDYNRMVREAFARLADPVEPWASSYARAAAEPDTGWISHWFSMSGEGELTVFLSDANVTLPHRPAAFPAFLRPDTELPVNGTMVAFQDLPNPKVVDAGELGRSSLDRQSVSDSQSSSSSTQSMLRPRSDLPLERACVPPTWPPIRPSPPKPPYIVALVERGDCDFATKVLAAQERGAAAVVVGDGVARSGETDEEGRKRENLITMYSPEDTSNIIIPSVFVSRASYLTLRDMLNNHTKLRVEVGEADDEGNALGSLLTFALLMPSLFLLATIAAHRVRIHRQREANRAPPTVVLSLPERVWTPDIVWEKDETDDSDDQRDDEQREHVQTEPNQATQENQLERAPSADAPLAAGDIIPGTSGIVVETLPAEDAAEHPPHRRRGKERRKSKRYYSKDECAICMENFSRGEIVRILPCGHVFHKDECDEWLLKWRKLCPTCRADVTESVGDISASTTLTPVVDAQANASTAAANTADYGATGAAEAGAEARPDGQHRFGWLGGFGDRVVARAGAAVTSVSDSLRAVFTGDGGNRPAVALDERTPLRANNNV